MPRLTAALALAALAVAVPATVVATAPAPAVAAQSQAGTPLNAPTIEAFIDTIPAIRKWTEIHQDQAREVAPSVLKGGALTGNPFARLIDGLRGTAAYDDLDTTVGRHGFQGPEDWAGVANRVTKALGVLAMNRDAEDNPIAAAGRELESNPDIAPEDRTMLKGLLLAVSLFAQAPKEDVQAVSPYTDRIITALRQPR